MKKFLVVLILLLLLILPVQAENWTLSGASYIPIPSGIQPYNGILTIGSSNPQINAITLNGWVNSTRSVWFRWGSSTELPIITEIIPNTSGNFSVTLTELPFIRNQTYYFSAGCYSGYGYINSFKLPDQDLVIQTNYGYKLSQLIAAKNNFTALAEVIGSVYTDRWGVLFYGVVWLAIIGAIWMRTEDIKIPLMAYILLSGTLNITRLMPANMVYFVYASIVIAMGALLYSLFKKRQD